MKIVELKEVEDCLDGSLIKDVFLDEPVSEGFIRYLGDEGRLEYFPDFARPFFRITRDRDFTIKGVEGNRSFQVVFFRDTAELEGKLREYIDKYPKCSQSRR